MSIATRRIELGGQSVELWEDPDLSFDCTPPSLRRYVLCGAWVTLFNAIALQGTPLRAE
jgi:hypothetical protein